jgi:hypothetical protein
MKMARKKLNLKLRKPGLREIWPQIATWASVLHKVTHAQSSIFTFAGANLLDTSVKPKSKE